MDTTRLVRKSDTEWWIEPFGEMNVPGIIFATEPLIRDMDDKVFEQVVNVARLPGIVKASFAMPDAHWGYGFPIGGVAAFDPEADGVISAGGVGFDISCGVRTLRTGLTADDIRPLKRELADALFRNIPAGVGSKGRLSLNPNEMRSMLEGGARWAAQRGYGFAADLDRVEEGGRMAGAVPENVSELAMKRQKEEMGTLGSGNHYLEVQKVVEIFDGPVAEAFGIREGDALLSIHCGSRGLGHQIGAEYLRKMTIHAAATGLRLPDRELACAPIRSAIGEEYLGAMRAGINCALANRQIITHLARQAFAEILPRASLDILYDVSHNTCKVEEHVVDGAPRKLFVHRKGATRAFGPRHPALTGPLKATGQPVLIGGSVGTASYILVGAPESEAAAFSSSCHGAGRQLSRHQALRRWSGRQVVDQLAARGIVVRSPSQRGIAEEAPDAYKDVNAVVDAAHAAGLSLKVARLEPMVCVKG
ncbi:MAG TPA: RtcB family protein [Terriglobia bacterium]|nr:RtcB family protein [Terriglobia bacterium]